MQTALEPVMIRIVMDGDSRIVYDEIASLAWILRIDAIRKGDRSVWTIQLHGAQPGPTDLLRVVLADRRLRIIEFRLLSLSETSDAFPA